MLSQPGVLMAGDSLMSGAEEYLTQFAPLLESALERYQSRRYEFVRAREILAEGTVFIC